MSKLCKQCSKPLINKQTSFCSKTCNTSYNNGANFDRKCKICENIFKGTRFQNYCSSECKSTTHKNKPSNKTVSTCVICGNAIIGSKTKKYCSRSCQNNNASINQCLVCGKDFKGSYKKKYCSRSCQNKGMNNARESIKKDKLMEARQLILEMYSQFYLIDIEFTNDIIWVKLECKKDRNIIYNRYDKLIKKLYECNHCKISQYYENPTKCKHCKKVVSFNKRKNIYCSTECSVSSKRFEVYYTINQNNSLLETCFRQGYTEEKVSKITSLPISTVKKYISNNEGIKDKLDLLEDTMLGIIKNNQCIDLKSQGFTRVSSQFFKNKHSSMLNFLSKHRIDYRDKFFKCSKCGEYHNILDFNTRKTTIKNSFFGIGICKICIKLEKDKRKRKSDIVDSMLDTSYVLHVRDKFNNKCAICGNDDNIHIDHFIPLAWNVSYPIQGNYILLCENCNVSHKRDLNINEWINTYNINYTQRIYNIMKWLALENNMSFVEYNNLYWSCYNVYIENKNC